MMGKMVLELFLKLTLKMFSSEKRFKKRLLLFLPPLATAKTLPTGVKNATFKSISETGSTERIIAG